MKDCWNTYPSNRPTFADLVNRLELLLNPPKKRQSHSQEPMYVNFSEFDNAEYLNPISAPPPESPAVVENSAPDLPSEPPPPTPPTPRADLPPPQTYAPPPPTKPLPLPTGPPPPAPTSDPPSA